MLRAQCRSGGRAPVRRGKTMTCTGASVESEPHYTATMAQALVGGGGLLGELDAEAVVRPADGDEDAQGQARRRIGAEVALDIETGVR